jgi:O-antigen/teichoic acid export membrane protein
VGGAILAKQLLRLYGPEFTQGSTVLVLLVLSVLLYSYQNQLVNALNGIDRPEIAFRISAIFIVLNAVLNVVLIWQFGIVGAAVATAVSAGVGLVLAYYALRQLVEFRIPIREPSRQIVAAVIMGGIVGTTLETIERTDIINYNAIIVFLLVGVGAGVYFAVLFTLSTKFRETVNRNLPVDVPYLL